MLTLVFASGRGPMKKIFGLVSIRARAIRFTGEDATGLLI
jgi:hypothetical protein